MINYISFKWNDSCAVSSAFSGKQTIRDTVIHGTKIKNKGQDNFSERVYIYIYVRIKIVSSLHIKAVFFHN